MSASLLILPHVWLSHSDWLSPVSSLYLTPSWFFLMSNSPLLFTSGCLLTFLIFGTHLILSYSFLTSDSLIHPYIWFPWDYSPHLTPTRFSITPDSLCIFITSDSFIVPHIWLPPESSSHLVLSIYTAPHLISSSIYLKHTLAASVLIAPHNIPTMADILWHTPRAITYNLPSHGKDISVWHLSFCCAASAEYAGSGTWNVWASRGWGGWEWVWSWRPIRQTAQWLGNVVTT